MSAIILLRNFSNHCPIILLDDQFDFGSVPFRYFNYWFLLEGLDGVVLGTSVVHWVRLIGD